MYCTDNSHVLYIIAIHRLNEVHRRGHSCSLVELVGTEKVLLRKNRDMRKVRQSLARGAVDVHGLQPWLRKNILASGRCHYSFFSCKFTSNGVLSLVYSFISLLVGCAGAKKTRGADSARGIAKEAPGPRTRFVVLVAAVDGMVDA